MSEQVTTLISHIGLCTADIECASAFYQGALDFEPLGGIFEVGAPFDVLVEQPGAIMLVQQLKCGGATIELLGFRDTAVAGAAQRRPMNQRGFTHMTLVVDDIDAVAARICDFGGQAHPETRVDSSFGPILFCTDPDGVRIELMRGNN